jgi:hypothetical protein
LSHAHLFATDLDYAAFYVIWRPYDFGDSAAELRARFQQHAEAEIAAAVARATLLRAAVERTPSMVFDAPPVFDEVVDLLRRHVPGVSEAAYRSAGDKVLFLMWR